MAGLTVERITCCAALDTATAVVDDARRHAAAGDEDMERWLEELRTGAACLVSIALVATLRSGDEEVAVRTSSSDGLWMEVPAHPAVAAKQIQESAAKAFSELAELMRQRGAEVTLPDLDQMLVSVEIEESLARIIREHGQRILPRTPRVANHPHPPHSDPRSPNRS